MFDFSRICGFPNVISAINSKHCSYNIKIAFVNRMDYYQLKLTIAVCYGNTKLRFINSEAN